MIGKHEKIINKVKLINDLYKKEKVKFDIIEVLDKKNLIEWVNKNLDDLDAGTLLAVLPKTKEFIKSELNYINRFLV